MCGILGYLSKDNPVSVDKIKLLFLSMKDRGEFSVGLLGDDVYNIQLGDVDDFIESTDWVDFRHETTLLGHNRKPSAGTVRNLDGAQPFSYGSEMEGEMINIVHNGTIRNADELKSKYPEVEFGKNDTDTQVLGKILFYLKMTGAENPYKVLDEIEGTATIIWFYNSNLEEMFIFKAKNKGEERPLFSIVIDDGIYFASTKEALKLICYNQDQAKLIKDLEFNKVLKITADDLMPEVIYKSTLKPEKDPVIYDFSETGDELDKIRKANIQYLFNVDYVTDIGTKNDIFDEVLISNMSTRNKLIFYKGRYWINNSVCDGQYSFNGQYEEDSKGARKLSFVQGVLISDNNNYWAARTAITRYVGADLQYGTKAFYNAVKRYTNMPIGIYIDKEVIFYGPNESLDFIYKNVGINQRYYEFMNGYFIYATEYRVSDINIGDKVTVDGNIGTVVSKDNFHLDVDFGNTAEPVRVYENEIQDVKKGVPEGSETAKEAIDSVMIDVINSLSSAGTELEEIGQKYGFSKELRDYISILEDAMEEINSLS